MKKENNGRVDIDLQQHVESQVHIEDER